MYVTFFHAQNTVMLAFSGFYAGFGALAVKKTPYVPFHVQLLGNNPRRREGTNILAL
jgi:hypothetical protein